MRAAPCEILPPAPTTRRRATARTAPATQRASPPPSEPRSACARAATAAGAACDSAPEGSRYYCGLEQIAWRIGKEHRQLVEQDAMRDEPLPRIGAASEEAEGSTHRGRRVMKRAAQRQLLVVKAVGVHRRTRVACQTAEHHDRAARSH